MNLNEDLDLTGQTWHFVGVLGTGMRGLATYINDCGATVSGSDVRRGPELETLLNEGIKVKLGQNRAQLGPDTDLVVASQAIGEDNPEIVCARRRDIEVLRYPEVLGMLTEHRSSIGVAGSHGKSTTASAIAYTLQKGGRDPSYLIGADIPQLGSSACLGQGDDLVVEACEYKRSFLYLQPETAVVTNIDIEHIDYYHGLWDIKEAFQDYISQVRPGGCAIINDDDPNLSEVAESAECEVVRCSLDNPDADYHTEKLWRATKHTNFDVVCDGRNVGRFYTSLYGEHNVRNALQAIAACHRAGMDFEEIQEVLAHFEGPARRMELVGEPWEVPVLSDYAHHPREISASIAAAAQRYPGRRIFCVFQPHQYSRTRQMMGELATAFEGAHRVIVSDIYSARDSLQDQESVNVLDLVKGINRNGQMALYVPDFEDIEDMVIGEVVLGDVVLVMGAGDIWQVAEDVSHGIALKPETQIAA